MKFVFCTEKVYNTYMSNSHLYTGSPTDFVVGDLRVLGYANNPVDEICSIFNQVSMNIFPEDPRFEDLVAEIILNKSEEGFFEMFDLVHKFYNGMDVFILIDEDALLILGEVFASIITNLYGIIPVMIYDIDDLDALDDTIGFSNQGLEFYSMCRPMYHKLLAKRSYGEPLMRYINTANVSLTNAWR